MENQLSKKWYQKLPVIIALLILFPPAGLFLMWKYTSWNKVLKGVITIVLAILFISTVSGGKTNTTQSSDVKVERVINYEIVKRWSIPNGGEGKTIIISMDNFNEADMLLLGEKLKEDTKKDRNAFIFVFTDKKAAEIRDKVLTDELTESDRDFYDKHYVAEYSRNGNSGFHEYKIYFDGLMGDKNKTIKY